ncbi:hypothetical protein ACC725_38210, partial [Rhizobium ruizarguesonis]
MIAAGATAVIQPGGSMRDQEVIDAANEHGVAMVFSLVNYMRGSPRLGMATLILFLAGGLVLLIRKPYPADRA